MRSLGKVPRLLAAFSRRIEREMLSKRSFFDFESPDSAVSRFPMTLMKFFTKTVIIQNKN
jgi:hypothetical protein